MSMNLMEEYTITILQTTKAASDCSEVFYVNRYIRQLLICHYLGVRISPVEKLDIHGIDVFI